VGKTQEQFLQETLDLKKENPNLEIVFCTAYDELCDEHAWSCQQIESIQILPWYEYKERIYSDEEDIREKMLDELDEDDDTRSDEEMEKLIDEMYTERIKQKICVYLVAGGA
jgi:hypothetical protein